MPRFRLLLAIAGIAIASLSLGVNAHGDSRYRLRTVSSQHEQGDRLSPDTRRALRRFEEQKHRDYRRLGERRFDSDRERERAYRKLQQTHHDRLRDILGESRFDEARFRHYHDDEHRREHDQRSQHDDNAARAFDPVAASASIAARWALNESDQDELADVLEDYQEAAQELHEERFDSSEERREAQRELEEDYQDDLEDILDDVSDADVGDILEHLLRY